MHTRQSGHWTHQHVFGQDQQRAGEKRTLLVVIITAVMMVVEIAAGVVYGSMALLADGWANAVRVEVDGAGRITRVSPGAAPEGTRIACLLPAPANSHSHAFQRAMAGLTERRDCRSSAIWDRAGSALIARNGRGRSNFSIARTVTTTHLPVSSVGSR